jgi:hypothetical protein
MLIVVAAASAPKAFFIEAFTAGLEVRRHPKPV